jgi:RNA polymerase sigma-70 factor (ECF subfamily)
MDTLTLDPDLGALVYTAAVMDPEERDEDAESRLVARAREGDRAALEALLQRHLPGLEAFVRLRVGRAFGRREGASDVVQSACRDVVLGVEGFRYGGATGFRKWLYAIAARKVADKFAFHNAQCRDVGREATSGAPFAGTSEAATSLIAQLSGAFASPSQEMAGAELLERLEAALDELEPDERDVVLLSRVAGLSRAEVAETMGRSEGSVRNLLHRTLVKLSGSITG